MISVKSVLNVVFPISAIFPATLKSALNTLRPNIGKGLKKINIKQTHFFIPILKNLSFWKANKQFKYEIPN